MAKKRSVDYALDEDRYNPERYPFACLPARKPSAMVTCALCDFKSIATTPFEAALGMRHHERWHHDKLLVEVTDGAHL